MVPFGQKIICRQKYVRIVLKAYALEGNVTDEVFYFPSHCNCEIVKPKQLQPNEN